MLAPAKIKPKMNAEHLAELAKHWTDTIEEALRGEVALAPACRMPTETEERAHLLGQLQGISLLLGESPESEAIRERIDALTREFTPLPAAFIV